MLTHSHISRTLRGDAARSRIVEILSQEQFGSRRALGRRVCREFAFTDSLGRLQVAGCLKALSGLSASFEEIVLPPPQREPIRTHAPRTGPRRSIMRMRCRSWSRCSPEAPIPTPGPGTTA